MVDRCMVDRCMVDRCMVDRCMVDRHGVDWCVVDRRVIDWRVVDWCVADGHVADGPGGGRLSGSGLGTDRIPPIHHMSDILSKCQNAMDLFPESVISQVVVLKSRG
jgi:hypothetical protein